MTSNQKIDVLTVEEAIASRRVRILDLLIKATLAELSPNSDGTAAEALDRALNGQ
jgi:hypothetical protein